MPAVKDAPKSTAEQPAPSSIEGADYVRPSKQSPPGTRLFPADQVTHPETLFAPGVAIFSYDLDEVETVFGNHMTARYHQIDTWLYRNRLWQIAASQVMRYYEDPATETINPALLPDYVGTYELAPGNQVIVTTHDGKLFAQRGASGNAKPTELLAESPDLFFRAGVEGRRLFHRNTQDKVDMLIDRRNNEDMLLKKVK